MGVTEGSGSFCGVGRGRAPSFWGRQCAGTVFRDCACGQQGAGAVLSACGVTGGGGSAEE